MSLADLIVHVDTSEAGKARAAFACDLAAVHGAHLSAVALVITGVIPQFVGPGVPPLISSAEILESGRDKARQALEDFTTLAGRAGISYETRTIEALPPNLPDLFVMHVRHADLAILGQPGESEVASSEEVLIEQVLYESGRAALVVPQKGQASADPKIVLAAWDGSQEAARAFDEAMPFFKRADQVFVTAVDPEQFAEAYGEQPGADIGLHLSRHGVKVEVTRVERVEEGVHDIGAMLLERGAEAGAQIIVMGAYHHSRLRQFILGGVTRTVLAKASVPVLMAH